MYDSWIDQIKDLIRLTTKQRTLYDNSFQVNTIISASTTGTTIYTAPAGRIFAVTDIHLSCNNDNTVTLYNGDVNHIIYNTFFQTTGNASSTVDHTYSTPYFSYDLGETINVKTTTNNTLFITMTGYLI